MEWKDSFDAKRYHISFSYILVLATPHPQYCTITSHSTASFISAGISPHHTTVPHTNTASYLPSEMIMGKSEGVYTCIRSGSFAMYAIMLFAVTLAARRAACASFSSLIAFTSPATNTFEWLSS